MRIIGVALACLVLCASGAGCGGSDEGDGTGMSCASGFCSDPATGLHWTHPSASKQGDELLGYCDALDLGGHADWRLPTLDELRTLVRGCAGMEPGGACTVTDSCLEMQTCWSDACRGCAGAQGPGVLGCYWDTALGGGCAIHLSSSAAGARKWGISFNTVGLDDFDPYSTSYATRCVRGP